MDTGERHKNKRKSWFDARITAVNTCDSHRDGVEVPVSRLHRKHFRKAHNLLLVYGYGSYGASTTPI
ncbi:MAG: hypothetical protein ACLRP3_07045 [Escherichia sp.]